MTSLRVEQRPGGRALVGEADILPAKTSSRVDEAWAAITFGARNGISIGFLPVEADREPVLPAQRGLTYRRVKLLEISSVSLPSCPMCLVESKAWRRRRKEGTVYEEPIVFDRTIRNSGWRCGACSKVRCGASISWCVFKWTPKCGAANKRLGRLD